jgi:hypothetical protein
VRRSTPAAATTTPTGEDSVSEQQFDDPLDNRDAAQEAEMEETDPSGGPSGYAPSRSEVNRGREQGLGVGQEDLNSQRDPTRRDSSEHY